MEKRAKVRGMRLHGGSHRLHTEGCVGPAASNALLATS